VGPRAPRTAQPRSSGQAVSGELGLWESQPELLGAAGAHKFALSVKSAEHPQLHILVDASWLASCAV
jgi:hypothetical protein